MSSSRGTRLARKSACLALKAQPLVSTPRDSTTTVRHRVIRPRKTHPCAELARYWEDPYAFKPSRFLGDWPRDAFLPFSGGARSCLGRRFSETEGVAILTYIIKHFRVDVLEEPQYAGETFEQRKTRLLKCKSAITL